MGGLEGAKVVEEGGGGGGGGGEEGSRSTALAWPLLDGGEWK